MIPTVVTDIQLYVGRPFLTACCYVMSVCACHNAGLVKGSCHLSLLSFPSEFHTVPSELPFGVA